MIPLNNEPEDDFPFILLLSRSRPVFHLVVGNLKQKLKKKKERKNKVNARAFLRGKSLTASRIRS